MADQMDVTITVQEPQADADRLGRLADDLRDALAEKGVDGRSRPPAGGTAPAGTRGDLETIGAVLVTAQTSVQLLGVIVATVREWLDRGRVPERSTSIELLLPGRAIKVDGVTPEQQQALIDEFLAAGGGNDRD